MIKIIKKKHVVQFDYPFSSLYQILSDDSCYSLDLFLWRSQSARPVWQGQAFPEGLKSHKGVGTYGQRRSTDRS